MAKFEMKIVREGSEKIYPITPAVIVAFEQEFGIPLADMTTMTQRYWIAWKCEFITEQKAGSVVKLFDDWLEDITDVDEIEAKESPTKGRSRSSSPQ